MAASSEPSVLEEAGEARTLASEMAVKVTTDAVQVWADDGWITPLALDFIERAFA